MASKQRKGAAEGILAAIDARQQLSHPHAETIERGQVWRVHGRGESTIAWVRHWTPPHGGKAWHLYYDALDDEGQRVWCYSFDNFNSAVAYAVQHAGEMKRGPR